MTTVWVPILDRATGERDAASYSNEADAREPDFVTAFYSRQNYPRLGAVKRAYDPRDLFIVQAGVGSERWDAQGICMLS
jgi:hypothetical protein